MSQKMHKNTYCCLFYIQFPEFISPLKKLMNPEFRNSAFEGPCDESLENYREERGMLSESTLADSKFYFCFWERKRKGQESGICCKGTLYGG